MPTTDIPIEVRIDLSHKARFAALEAGEAPFANGKLVRLEFPPTYLDLLGFGLQASTTGEDIILVYSGDVVARGQRRQGDGTGKVLYDWTVEKSVDFYLPVLDDASEASVRAAIAKKLEEKQVDEAVSKSMLGRAG